MPPQTSLPPVPPRLDLIPHRPPNPPGASSPGATSKVNLKTLSCIARILCLVNIKFHNCHMARKKAERLKAGRVIFRYRHYLIMPSYPQASAHHKDKPLPLPPALRDLPPPPPPERPHSAGADSRILRRPLPCTPGEPPRDKPPPTPPNRSMADWNLRPVPKAPSQMTAVGGETRGSRELSNRHSLPLALPSALDGQRNSNSVGLEHQLVGIYVRLLPNSSVVLVGALSPKSGSQNVLSVNWAKKSHIMFVHLSLQQNVISKDHSATHNITVVQYTKCKCTTMNTQLQEYTVHLLL